MCLWGKDSDKGLQKVTQGYSRGGWKVSHVRQILHDVTYSVPWRRIRKLCKVVRYLAKRTLYISTTFEGTVGYTPSKTLDFECETVMWKDSA